MEKEEKNKSVDHKEMEFQKHPVNQTQPVDKYWVFENLCESRENQFDKNFNKINYCIELKKTEELFEQFSKTLREQIMVLAFGGNRLLLELINKEDAESYALAKIYDKENEYWVLSYLWDKYCHVTPGYSGLCYNIKRNRAYIDIEKEKILRKIFKD